MASLPTDEAIRARAEQLQLLAPGAALDSRTRAKVAQILVDEAHAAAATPAAAAPQLLSSVRYPVEGGTLLVSVTFHPTPKG